MATTLGTLNPLTYRGYVYDQETGLYYLQSRYYNPEWGRFINADALVATGQGMLGNNMFAYCRNNPVSRKDISGTDDVDCFDSDADPSDDDEGYAGGRIGSGGNPRIEAGSGIKIYRHGGTNPGNLKPKLKDLSSGLSFSTIAQKGSLTTTIEAVNETGILRAVQDSSTHVSVTPVNGTMQDWYIQGAASIWTKTLLEIGYKE